MVDHMKVHTTHFLCELTELEATGAVGIDGIDPEENIVVVRCGKEVRGYINRCPHIGTPLEMFPNKFLDETGSSLVCSTHGARFNVHDGLCTSGPCVGLSLQPVSLIQKDEKIFLEEGHKDS